MCTGKACSQCKITPGRDWTWTQFEPFVNFKEPAQTLKSDDVDAAAITAGGSVKLAAALKLLVLSCLPSLALGLNNGAALTPPLGWQNWNGFGMRFNASLFKDMADAMAKNGLLAAGYTLISAGGS
jgi:hypothetical protein